MNSQDLVTVYTVANSVQAEIIKNALQAEGIRCFVDGINQAAEAGLMASKSRFWWPTPTSIGPAS